MSVRVNVDTDRFLRWFQKEPGRAEEMRRLFQYHGGQMVLQEMKRQAPERTGFLKATITTELTPEGFTVYPGASYAPIVEGGSRPHEILARFAKALAFPWKGKLRFFKRVRHPGSPGRRFVERTSEIVEPKLFDLMRRLWRELHER
ncbi:MAG: HK97 gp10 family phage protein [Candidatus Bathyarchaeia archaeon]